MAPRGWDCIRDAATPRAWGGEGVAQDRGWGGHFSVTTSTRVGEGLRGANGQALPSLVTVPGGMEETER